MPHLSPMSWITSIIMFWTAVSIMTSSMWWSWNNAFIPGTNSPSSLNYTPWKWL
nr:ATP synthase subunit 8 [Dendrobaena tellermanica]